MEQVVRQNVAAKNVPFVSACVSRANTGTHPDHHARGTSRSRSHREEICTGSLLGTYVLAAMIVDLLWCVFMIAGLEQVHFGSGAGAANYFVATNIAWSHSLLTDSLWAILFASCYFLMRRNTRGAWPLFAVVLSHWILDVVSHRPDMPHLYFGLNLWSSVPASVIVEGGFWRFAVVLYARASRPKNRAGSYLYWTYFYWIGVALITLAWYSNLTGPPPRDPHTAPMPA